MAENSLKQIEKLGQSVWLDYINRDLIRGGELKRMIMEDCLRGMTSNPVLFEQAILQNDGYNSEIHRMVHEGRDVNQIYHDLTTSDVQEAADVFREVYDKTDKKDGYVSLEVNPHLAHDTEGTIKEARYLWAELARPNVYIKVPATKEGLPAIKQLISEGINVNVTILFGLPRYREVTQAFIEGLEARAAEGKSLHEVRSVASFFLSRIDVLVDGMLEKMLQGEKAELAKKLQGEVAIASAKLAYQDYLSLFSTSQFEKLAKQGAKAQRLLWASTGTKNPAYSDTKYVEPLIGANTVNTMPLETLKAYRNHGKPELRLEDDVDHARWVLENLNKVGIDINQVTQQLEDEGVDKFNKAFDTLMESLGKVCTKHK
jgi:transaldolase